MDGANMAGQGLEGLQVIELGGGVSAPMAGKMLAGLGATVLKIEPPGGEPARRRGPFPQGVPGPEASGTYLYLNTNKRSLELDLTAREGRATLAGLAERADLLLHNFTPAEMETRGISYERLSGRNPRLVMLSITPFGLSGPYRDYAANELTLIHGGGWGWIIPGKGAPPELPPIKPFGQHVLVHAGLHGLVAALAACRGAAQSGLGEHIDLSVQETVVFLLGRHFSIYSYTGQTDKRTSPTLYEPMNFYPCQDGHIFLICPEQSQWQRFVKLMGEPAWALEERFSSREQRSGNAQALLKLIAQWTAGWKVDDLFHACQQERVGAAPVFDFPQLERQEHLLAREFYVEQSHPVAGALRMPGAPFHLKQPWWRPSEPAPRLGEAARDAASLFAPLPELAGNGGAGQARKPPLAGVRVLDLSWVWAGPHCTQMMAMLGAEVIKVESSSRLDLTRRSRLQPPGMEPGHNLSAYYNQINQCKKSIGIDLSNPEGIALVKQLAESSHVMISNFGTGVLEKLGLGAEEMQRINPRLHVAMISAFGQTGPSRYYMGYGPLISPLAGVSAQTGYADGLPQDVGMAYGDPNGGVYCAIALTAALWAGLRHGAPGQVIDLSMWEAMLCTGFEGWMNHALGNPPYRPMGNRDPVDAPHNVYASAGEDAWVAVAVSDQAQWRGLCRAIGQPNLADDARFRDAPARKANEDALDALLGAWCAGRERWEATRALQAEGVPAFPVLDTKDLQEDPHLLARKCFTNWPHAEAGLRTMMGAPWRMAFTPNGNGHAAPLLGEHTDYVLEAVLGLSTQRRAELREAHIVE
ncbi:MAG: CoA transferase [SAR324 cluster bacterium]|nr:CoA transferase [SAR324 cluster bacterium]